MYVYVYVCLIMVCLAVFGHGCRCWLRLFRVCFCVVVFVKIWCFWFVVLVCSRLCVCVDSSSLDTISRGAWPFLIGRVTCLSDLVCVRAVKKKEREKQQKEKETCLKRDTHNTTCTHKTTHPTHHITFFY